jgi:serine/threonine protein kinase
MIRGQPVILMEFIDGLDLSGLAAGGGGILYQGAPAARVLKLLDIFIQVARGLGYAHSLGLANLDIKPRNILVEKSGRVLIGDYGPLSLRLEAISPVEHDLELISGGNQVREEATCITGARLIGTPPYFSPEAASGQSAPVGSYDLWALALTALECFLGRRPWEMGSVVARALEQYLADPRPATPIPPAAADFFRRALAEKQTSRYQDAEAVEAALEGLYQKLAGQPYPRPKVWPEAETKERLARKNASFKELGRLDLIRKACSI